MYHSLQHLDLAGARAREQAQHARSAPASAVSRRGLLRRLASWPQRPVARAARSA